MLTVVGGKTIHAADEFAPHAPPPLPMLPEGSPMKIIGGCGAPRDSRKAARAGVPMPQHQHSTECQHGGCAHAAHQLSSRSVKSKLLSVSPLRLGTKPGKTLGKVTVSGLNATGVYRSAISVESWSDEPITNVVLRDVQVEFAGGVTAAQAQQSVKRPGVDARSLPAWGLYARHVQTLTLEDLRFSLALDEFRPAIHADRFCHPCSTMNWNNP